MRYDDEGLHAVTVHLQCSGRGDPADFDPRAQSGKPKGKEDAKRAAALTPEIPPIGAPRAKKHPATR